MFNKEQLITGSLSEIRSMYKTLPSTPSNMCTGEYKAEFIGPWWLRKSAAPSLHLSGLGGWFGKKFLNASTVTNILINSGQRIEILQMRCLEEPSLLDGQVTVALHYGPNSPIPWRWVVDELRQLDDQTMLCMTVINLPILRNFSFPFILSREL